MSKQEFPTPVARPDDDRVSVSQSSEFWPAVNLVAKVIQFALLALIALYVITGFGITEYQIVTALTFGLVDKATALKTHDILFTPFAIVLVLHIALTSWRRLARRRTKQ